MRHSPYKRGFTLLELIVSVGLFSIVVTIATGAIITVMNLSQKARAYETIMSNLNFAVDSMVREMRMGKNYDCGGGGAPTDCPSDPGASRIVFTAYDGSTVEYGFDAGKIVRTVNGGVAVPLTSTDISISTIKFYVEGTDPVGDNSQPKIMIVLQGLVYPGRRTQTSFNLQTLVSQRLFDQ